MSYNFLHIYGALELITVLKAAYISQKMSSEGLSSPADVGSGGSRRFHV